MLCSVEGRQSLNASPQPQSAANSRLLDVRAVAHALQCSIRHVYRLADAGRMPSPVRLGALVRWNPEDIDEWIRSGCKAVRHLPSRTGGQK